MGDPGSGVSDSHIYFDFAARDGGEVWSETSTISGVDDVPEVFGDFDIFVGVNTFELGVGSVGFEAIFGRRPEEGPNACPQFCGSGEGSRPKICLLRRIRPAPS